jgi:ribonuclease R
MTAERACEACYKAEYMLAHVGETFDGVVVSVGSFGAYVQLSNTVDGLLPLHELDDAAPHFDGIASIVGAEGERLLTTGDTVRVTVAACDVSVGHIDFVPAKEAE